MSKNLNLRSRDIDSLLLPKDLLMRAFFGCHLLVSNKHDGA
jgi:hypothetical protein